MEALKTQKEQQAQSKKNKAIFFKPSIQKKLSVGSANDSYEVEADQIADKIMKMSEPSQNITQTGALIQRKCAHCEQEEKLQMKPLAESISPFIQRSSSENGGVAPDHVESQINSNKGGGKSMDSATKNFMENRFGTDFSDVKIHTGSEAVQMSRELGAQAFAVGNDIYFNEGKYNPNSDSGKHLLAHELTHTVQQSGGIGRMVQRTCPTTSCAGYTNSRCTEYIRNSWWLPSAYVNNATLACLETPNHPTAKCVRKTLQERLIATPSHIKALAASFKHFEITNLPLYESFVTSIITPIIYSDHVIAYRTAGCPSGPASYAAWIAVTTIPMPPGTVGLSIFYGGGSCSGVLGSWC
ncbi:hypothetical protein CHRY9390_00249 [Chryseobacterium aquaeductus]|uniref:eCIS core domain-containing protein n=1 Tax=Chryseobacterium aquaeductus TaxID=2675056 RepID=A0A9N8MDR9_9FLAO|nr:DUF4157 domain-containing protein [Chryseobacterium aquaeductus]CAA7329610.1 hypothetical protein CHRY9390_00249 [Chryseobacterium potabilaquae]CAD7797916.1 hypothetical protein CHRY9390_00249 [Chryseobacterium aquaeductus]